MTTAPKGEEALRIINEGYGKDEEGEEEGAKGKKERRGWFW